MLCKWVSQFSQQTYNTYSDRSGIRRPDEEDNLRALSSIGSLVLKVVNGVSAVVLRKLAQEVVVSRLLGGLGDNNLGLLVVQGVDDELVSLSQLQFIEDSESLVADGNTRSGLDVVLD